MVVGAGDGVQAAGFQVAGEQLEASEGAVNRCG